MIELASRIVGGNLKKYSYIVTMVMYQQYILNWFHCKYLQTFESYMEIAAILSLIHYFMTILFIFKLFKIWILSHSSLTNIIIMAINNNTALLFIIIWYLYSITHIIISIMTLFIWIVCWTAITKHSKDKTTLENISKNMIYETHDAPRKEYHTTLTHYLILVSLLASAIITATIHEPPNYMAHTHYNIQWFEVLITILWLFLNNNNKNNNNIIMAQTQHRTHETLNTALLYFIKLLSLLWTLIDAASVNKPPNYLAYIHYNTRLIKVFVSILLLLCFVDHIGYLHLIIYNIMIILICLVLLAYDDDIIIATKASHDTVAATRNTAQVNHHTAVPCYMKFFTVLVAPTDASTLKEPVNFVSCIQYCTQLIKYIISIWQRYYFFCKIFFESFGNAGNVKWDTIQIGCRIAI